MLHSACTLMENRAVSCAAESGPASLVKCGPELLVKGGPSGFKRWGPELLLKGGPSVC